ncbi:MAG TPA: hypothetical protein VNK95_02075, partial [Caldilineaceae bacterium]|nr:hypothetical protein [Caldilineaceae bacterium]
PYPTSASGDTGQLAIARATGALLLDAPDGAPLHQLEPGALVLLFARTADNGWVQAQRAHDPAQNGWIATSQLYLSNLAALPAMGVAAPAAGNEGAAASEANTPATESIARRLQVTVASDGDRLNIRSGPGISYPVIAKALDEESYTALGRNAKGDWLQIDTTAGNAALYEVAAGWVAVEFVTTTGQIDTLPVVEPQAPPPTRTPSPGGNLAGSSLNNVSISAAGARPVSGLTGVLVFQTSPGGMIYGYDLATGATWPLTNGFDPAISPDGGTVAFVRDGGESGLYLIDIDGSNERRIYAGAARLSSPKWSPDGHWIVFTRGNEFIECRQVGLSCVEEGSLPPGFEIDDEEMPLVRQYSYVLSRVDRNGENYRDIPSLASARAADWNEAGIVYQSDAGLQITTDTPDAENRLVIFDFLKPHFADPDWQPNSGRIAYMGREASHHEIFALNPDGSGATALTRPATTLVDEIPANVAPAWSPDGQHIVFLSNRAEGGEAGDWRIWVMEADGSNPRPLPIDIPITYTYGGEQAVDWGPAAR